MGLFDWLFGKKSAACPKAKIKGEEIGCVTHYFPHVGVAVIDLKKGSIKKGDKIHIHGHTTDFTQSVDSLQIEHKDVENVNKGQDFGVKVKGRVRVGDTVYKI